MDSGARDVYKQAMASIGTDGSKTELAKINNELERLFPHESQGQGIDKVSCKYVVVFMHPAPSILLYLCTLRLVHCCPLRHSVPLAIVLGAPTISRTLVLSCCHSP